MSATFTLQVNNSGAWRNVVKGNKEQMQQIEEHVCKIASVMGAKDKWRIIDSAFNEVIGYCNTESDYTWVPPK